jgi:uncharacterized protein (TIGR03067 family)
MKLMLLILALGLVPGADEKKDIDVFKGTWKISSVKINGDAPPEMKGTFTFDGTDLKIKLGSQDHQVTFKLDSTKKPKEIDVTPGDGPQAGMLMRGIYSLSKDELKICLAHPEQDRPKSLDKPGENVIVVTLKKAK